MELEGLEAGGLIGRVVVHLAAVSSHALAEPIGGIVRGSVEEMAGMV